MCLFLQFHYFQIHPWLSIINGVQQEKEKIQMVNKGAEDKGKEDEVEKNNDTNGEADNNEENKAGEDTEEGMDNEQNAMDIVPWMENMEEHIKHDGKIKQD